MKAPRCGNPLFKSRRFSINRLKYMDIGVPFRLLGSVESGRLAASILSQSEEAWFEQVHRQRAYDVHHQTASIVLLFCDESWPDGEVFREPGWARLADTAMPLVETIIAQHYAPGGTVLRAMAAKLKAGGRIAPHIDSLNSFRVGHRIHVPITTHPRVRFTIDGKPLLMQPGNAYEINNQKVHSVMNAGSEDRISFIFDYVEPAP
jgi:quercetin dioxygenase-like cupin family protein